MSRKEKVIHLINLIYYIEGVKKEPEYFEDYSDRKLDEKIDFYEYVSTK